MELLCAKGKGEQKAQSNKRGSYLEWARDVGPILSVTEPEPFGDNIPHLPFYQSYAILQASVIGSRNPPLRIRLVGFLWEAPVLALLRQQRLYSGASAGVGGRARLGDASSATRASAGVRQEK